MADTPLTSKQRLLAAINESNATLFKDADLTFGNPSVQLSPPDRNTAVVVRGTGSTTYVGPETVHFNRLDLAVQFGGVDLVFEDQGYLRTGELLPEINERFGTTLDITDVIDEPLNQSQTEYPRAQLLRALNTSYGYIGQMWISLIEATD